jgi:hypothetical protein
MDNASRCHEAVDEHGSAILVDLVFDGVGVGRNFNNYNYIDIVRAVDTGTDAIETHFWSPVMKRAVYYMTL